MGKIKTVKMGDLEAEETARKKAEAKRAQKKIAKKEPSLREANEVSAEAILPVEEKKIASPAKRGRNDKYVFKTGKKYNTAKALVDPKKIYSVADAMALVKKTSYSKFDGSVEVHLNVTEKNLRGSITLPHGNGKTLRIKIADDKLVENPVIDFDVLVATPAMMPKLAKIAKILGPKGLMPNPKTGTISDDPEKLVKSLSSSLSWKTQNDFPIIHAVIGKISFEAKKLEENFLALTKSIGKDKITSVFVKPTMGPSVSVFPRPKANN